MPAEPRQLGELISIGPAMLRDFEILGVRSVAQLARQNPERLYEKLCRVAPEHQDICCLDVFRAAVAQARNPRLPVEQCQWWYWSRKRKQAAGREEGPLVHSRPATKKEKASARSVGEGVPRRALGGKLVRLRSFSHPRPSASLWTSRMASE